MARATVVVVATGGAVGGGGAAGSGAAGGGGAGGAGAERLRAALTRIGERSGGLGLAGAAPPRRA
jgi:hypothetical protein